MANLTQCVKSGNTTGYPGWLIKFDYDADLIERLKREIHHTEREWREGSKEWWISQDSEDVLDKLFSNWYALAKLQGTLF